MDKNEYAIMVGKTIDWRQARIQIISSQLNISEDLWMAIAIGYKSKDTMEELERQLESAAGTLDDLLIDLRKTIEEMEEKTKK